MSVQSLDNNQYALEFHKLISNADNNSILKRNLIRASAIFNAKFEFSLYLNDEAKTDSLEIQKAKYPALLNNQLKSLSNFYNTDITAKKPYDYDIK